MQNAKICSDILRTIQTRQDVNRLVGEVEVLKTSLFKIGQGNWDEIIGSQVSATTAQVLKGVGEMDRELVLSELGECLKTVSSLKLTVAFTPSSGGLGELGAWVKANLGESVVLDVAIDPKILGGAVIEYGGRYIDKTLSEALNTYFNHGKV